MYNANSYYETYSRNLVHDNTLLLMFVTKYCFTLFQKIFFFAPGYFSKLIST